MKKLSLLFAVAAMFVFAGCGKYEDGPGFSLLSRKARIVGEWELDKYLYDNVDETASVMDGLTSFNWKFDTDGDLTITVSDGVDTQSSAMTWAFANDDADLNLTYNGSTDTYKILRLTNSEVWFETNEFGVTEEWRLKAK